MLFDTIMTVDNDKIKKQLDQIYERKSYFRRAVDEYYLKKRLQIHTNFDVEGESNADAFNDFN